MNDNYIVVIDPVETIPQLIITDNCIQQTLFVPPAYGVAIPGPIGPKGDKGEKGDTGLPGSGSVVLITTTNPIGGGRVIAINNEVPVYASNDNISLAKKVIGISENASDSNSELIIKTHGIMTDSSWNWDTSKPLYLGINGLITQTYPDSADYLLVIGEPLSNDTIKVLIETPIILK